MKFRLVPAVFLLIGLGLCLTAVPKASCSRTTDSWVKVDVLSFSGETISFAMQIYVIGNHTDSNIWVHGEFSRDSVFADVGRGISDVVFYDNMNVTVFSYSYSYVQTYYQAKPKLFGFLLFPWDEHKLVLFISSSFNYTMDEHDWLLDCASPNYEGKYYLRNAAISTEPFRYQLTIEIVHPTGFSYYVSALLMITIMALIVLSFMLTYLLYRTFKQKKSRELLRALLPSSWAIIFFVPVFEVSLQNLKHPLAIVFSDIIMLLIILWNSILIGLAIYLQTREK